MYNQMMYNREREDNRFDAKKAWERETDISYMMNQYKNAGINPYMVTGQSFNAPTASSASAKPYQTMDNSALSNIPTAMASMLLLNAQKENIQADTAVKQATAKQANIQADVQQKYADPTAQATLDQINATRENLQETKKLIPEQVQAQKLNNVITHVEAYNAQQEKKLDLEAKTIQNNKSRQEINNIKASTAYYNSQISKVKTELEKLQQDIANGKATQKEIEARTLSIYAKLPEELKAIERSNQPIYNPKGLIQDIKEWKEPRVDSSGYWDNSGWHRTK